MADFFKYEVDKRLAPFWLPFGLHPSTDGVTITDDGKFVAKYGFLKLETSVSNIDDAHITGLPVVDGRRGSDILRRRWADVRHERPRRSVRSLRRTGPLAAAAEGPFRPDRHRRRPGRSGRATRPSRLTFEQRQNVSLFVIFPHVRMSRRSPVEDRR